MSNRKMIMLSAVASIGLLAACNNGGDAEEADATEEETEEVVLADPCPDQVATMRGSGDPFTCSCTPEAAEEGTVWGSGPYTDDSRVCRAAMHAGLLADGPANVTINFLPGRESYTMSDANGVETRNYGRYGGSYAFEGAALGEPPEEIAAAIEACPSSAVSMRGTTDALTCSCSPAAASSTSTVWGSETYTDDSAICVAAVHAGVIGTDGGNVTVTPSGGLESYSGSTANGVTTRNYGSYSGSFTVEEG